MGGGRERWDMYLEQGFPGGVVLEAGPQLLHGTREAVNAPSGGQLEGDRVTGQTLVNVGHQTIHLYHLKYSTLL